MLKTTKAFKSNPGFKEGKILLMGEFLRYMRQFNKSKHHLINLLGKANMRITRCSIKEAQIENHISENDLLKTLGITLLECAHRGSIGEHQCLLAFLQNGNPKAYFLAAVSNVELEWGQTMKDVPVLCGQGNQIVVRDVSDVQQQLADEGA